VKRTLLSVRIKEPGLRTLITAIVGTTQRSARGFARDGGFPGLDTPHQPHPSWRSYRFAADTRSPGSLAHLIEQSELRSQVLTSTGLSRGLIAVGVAGSSSDPLFPPPRLQAVHRRFTGNNAEAIQSLSQVVRLKTLEQA